MKLTNVFFLLLLAIAPTAPLLAADAYVIVVHPDNPVSSISKAEAAQYFLKQKTRWPDGARVEPAEQVGRDDTRAAFCENVLGRSVSAVEAYWQQQIFSGREVPPVRLDSDADVVRFVSERPGAIGYVSAAPSGDVKILTVDG